MTPNKAFSMTGRADFRTITFLATAIAVAVFTCAPAAAQKGGKGKGGGGGGGDTGAETIVNPAFVFKKNGALHLLTHDGSRQLPLTNPGRQAEDSRADWSPDGSRIAFLRQPDASSTLSDLYVVDLYEDANGIDPARSDEQLVIPIVSGEFDAKVSWGPTGELVINDALYLYAIDPDEINPVKRALLDFTEDNTLPMPEGFAGDRIELFRVRSVDVQPTAFADTVIIALVADWDVIGANGYFGADIFLVDADVSTGRLVVDRSTIRNLTNPNFVNEIYMPEYLDWSQDGLQLTFQEWYGIYADGDQQIVSYDLLFDDFTVLIVGEPNDGSAAPNQPHSVAPDGLEIALGVGTPVKGGDTYDVFRVPANQVAYGIRGPEAVNVTNTLKSSAREVDPVWRPTWIRQ